MLSVTDVRQFYLGVQGENEEQTITVDVRPWLASYPNGVVTIWHKRNGESVPTQTGATFDPEEGTIVWVPTYTDTYVAGEGEAEVRLYDNGVIKKTRKVKTGVAPSVTGAAGVTLESGWQGYINYIDSQAQAAISAKEDAEDAKEDAQAAQTAAETAQGLAEDAQLGAENAQTAAETAQGKAEDAQEAAEDAQDAAETAVEHYPYVDETTGDWFVWDADNGAWVDTGVHAKGDTGTVPDISVGTVTTLQPDQPATVTRRQGSPDTAPIFDFGIPKGETGQAGNIYGNTIDMSSSDSTKVSAAINEKASKVASATENNFAALDANGDLKDSGHKHSDYLTSHQDISGKADKVSGGTENNFAALDSSGNLKDSGHKHSDYLTSHQDISGKADKVSSATSGDFAALDGNGNLTDSGHKHADYKTAQTAVTDPSASGTTDQFIATISQDANGVITPTKKTVQDATTSAHGLMSASDKSKLDNISQMTKRYVTLAVATSEWTLSSGVYTAEFTTAYVTATSHEKIFWDKAYFDYAVTAVDATKKSGGGGVILTTATIPTGTIQGQLEIIDNDDGKIPTIIEATTVPIANGGTGASNLAGAKANLEIPTVVNVLNSSSTADALSAAKGKELAEHIAPYSFTNEYSSLLSMINNKVTTNGKSLPFSFMKAGSASLSDVPSSIGTAEFSGIVTGCSPRLEVEISQYGSDNDFRREIYNGAWRTNDWYSKDTVDDLSSSIGAYTGFTITDKYLRKNGKIVSLSVKLTAGSSDITFPAWQALLTMDASVKPPVSMNVLGVVNYSQACNPYVAGSLANNKAYVSSASAITVPAGKTISICGTWMV